MTGDPSRIAALLVSAFLATVGVTAGLRVLLVRVGSVDRPRQDRWHRAPVARPGGPALYGVWIVLTLALHPDPWHPPFLGVVVGTTLMFIVGLVDDLLRLATVPKLLLLIVVACVPPLFGVQFGGFTPVVAIPLTIFWILGITNAFNWLDNIDGLAAGIAAIVSIMLIVHSLSIGDAALAGLAATTAGVALGFLVFNLHPARVFMGDSGSGFLGFTLALLPVVGTARAVRDVVTALVVPVLILSVPIFDTVVVSLNRLLSGRSVLQGGTDHPSHRLVALGLSERRAVLNLYVLSLLSGGVALAAARLDPLAGLVLTMVAVALFTAWGVVLSRVRIYRSTSPPDGFAGVALVQVRHKRRIVEMLFDLMLLSAAFVGANLLRFEGSIPPPMDVIMIRALPAFLAIKMAIMYAGGLYRGDWRYVGLIDIFTLVKASTIASLGVVTLFVLTTRLENFSRAALILDWLLTIGLLGGTRLSIRLLQETLAVQRDTGRPVLIFGAGEGGLVVLSELRNNATLGMHPVGFVDDDPDKRGVLIRGLPVLGSRHDIPILVKKHSIVEVLISAPTMTAVDIEAVLRICGEAGASCRMMQLRFE